MQRVGSEGLVLSIVEHKDIYSLCTNYIGNICTTANGVVIGVAGQLSGGPCWQAC